MWAIWLTDGMDFQWRKSKHAFLWFELKSIFIHLIYAMDLFDEFSDCQTEADPTSPDLARDRRRGGTWGRVQTPAVTATFWKPLVRRRADQRQDPRADRGSLRRRLRVSNNITWHQELMPVTHDPTSWMRHVVCEVSSKKLGCDMGWHTIRLFFLKFYYSKDHTAFTIWNGTIYR